VAATLVAFSPALQAQFIDFDDGAYVYSCPEVLSGLTPQTMAWAWKTMQGGNYHPLTWLSLMLDQQLFGPTPGAFHTTNVLLHAANAVLLFVLLRRATAASWPSFFAAALFALHPLRVESVAWVSERKDLLSTLFGLLALLAYIRYAERPSAGRYVLVAAGMALSLLAKPMLVTLPFVLLLLDYWPLRRSGAWRVARGETSVAGNEDTATEGRRGPLATHHSPPATRHAPLVTLLLEKAPLLVLSLAMCVVTVLAQEMAGSFRPLESLTPAARVATALIGYVQYLRQTLLPLGLAPFYPHTDASHDPALAAGAAVLLLAITALVLRYGRDRPYLPVGWFWYLGTLLPVIGLVQVGLQSRADRYTYFPQIGLFLMLTWGVTELARRRDREWVAGALAGAVLAGLLLASHVQAGYWHDSVKLWEHSLRTTGGNWMAYNLLGVGLMEKGKHAEAERCFRKGLELAPDNPELLSNLGLALMNQGNDAAAEPLLAEAVRRDPQRHFARFHLAAILMRQGHPEQAVEHCHELLKSDTYSGPSYNLLGLALKRLGKPREAVAALEEAAHIDPDVAMVQYNLGQAYEACGEWAQAAACYRRCVDLEPATQKYHQALSQALEKLSKAPQK
jgi:Flp pilus assembly protein TadD